MKPRLGTRGASGGAELHRGKEAEIPNKKKKKIKAPTGRASREAKRAKGRVGIPCPCLRACLEGALAGACMCMWLRV